MSLIQCPECKKEISDTCKTCIHCGYELPKKEPIFQGFYCPKCLGTVCMPIFTTCPRCNIKYIPLIKGTIEEIETYCDNHPELKETPEFDNSAYLRRINWKPINYGSGAKCPTCQSTNIKKISATSKAVGAMAFGLFSKTARSQFCCNNCGYKW